MEYHEWIQNNTVINWISWMNTKSNRCYNGLKYNFLDNAVIVSLKKSLIDISMSFQILGPLHLILKKPYICCKLM